MYVLDGGPRAGQLVDDLPEGYTIDVVSRRLNGAVVVGDIPATPATWHRPAAGPGRALRRID